MIVLNISVLRKSILYGTEYLLFTLRSLFNKVRRFKYRYLFYPPNLTINVADLLSHNHVENSYRLFS